MAPHQHHPTPLILEEPVYLAMPHGKGPIPTYAPWYTEIDGRGYHHDEVENAWSRMLAFFNTHI